jgi:hypothetical protein
MKTSFINIRTFAIALVAIASVAFSTPALANDKAPQPTELKYLGQYKSYPVFEVFFNSEEASDYVVTIRDDQQNVIYKDFIKNGIASKRYLLNTDELGDASVQFEITSKKTDKVAVYEINRNIVYTNDLVVNKLK